MKILYFAKVREFIGYAEEEINLPSDIKTVDDVLDYLISKDSKYEMAFGSKDSIHVACDEEHVKKDFVILNTTEIAIFPPVTGG